MAWQTELKIEIDDSNPLLPPTTTVRIEVMPPGDPDLTPIFTIDVPATKPTTNYTLAVGDGTSIPLGDYALRIRGINDTLHSVSQEFSTWLHVGPPAPMTPTLVGTPIIELTSTGTPTPTSPATQPGTPAK